MAKRGYTVDVNGNKQTTQTYVVFPGGTKGEILRFRMPAGTKIELNDNDTGRAAKGLRFKRSGEDLMLALPGSTLANPDVIIEGFYARGGKGAELIGRGPDGKTYAYAGVETAGLQGRETGTQIAGKPVSPWGSPDASLEGVSVSDAAHHGAGTGTTELAPASKSALATPATEAAPAAAAEEGGGFRWSTLGWGLGGLALVGVAAGGAGGGGGGDSASSGPPSNTSDGPVSRVEAGAIGTTDDQIAEGKSLVFTVSLREVATAPTAWSFAIGGTATGVDLADVQFSDGVVLSNGMLQVPAGVQQFTITVRTAEDTTIEAHESLTVAVNGVTATASLIDNDKPGVTAVEPGAPGVEDDRVIEGSPVTLRVTLSDPSPKAETYKLSFGGAADATDVRVQGLSDGVTYDAATGLLTVPAQISAFNLTLDTPVDAKVEAAEALTVRIDDRQASLTIADLMPSAITASSATEGSPLSFTVTLNGSSPNPTNHSYALTGGTAGAGADFGNASFTAGVSLGAGGVLQVPGGVSSFQVVIATLKDNIVEGDETVQLTVDGVRANGTIAANGTQGVTNVTASTNSVSEGAAVTYTVTLNGPSDKTESHVFKIGDLPAGNYGGLSFSQGVSYNAGNQSLLVPAGVTNFTVTLNAADNARDDPTLNLEVNLGGFALPLSITDNDPAPTVSVSGPATFGEGVGTAAYTVALSQASGQVVSVRVQAGGGNATAGSDYAALDQVVTFQPGVTSQTVSVNVINDTQVEDNETFGVQLSQPSNATLAVGSVTTTLVDNDDPIATLRGPATIAEGAGPATYTVSLSHAATQAVTINYATTAGTAGATDFAAASGTLTIAAGQSSGSFTVGIVDDTIEEPAQAFNVVLTNPVHATLSNNSVSTTITDNGDSQRVSSVAGTTGLVVEGTPAVFVVTVEAAEVAHSHALQVSGTAAAGADIGAVTVTGASYNAATGLVTVAAGVTQFSVSIATVDDRIFEFLKTITLTVGSSTSSINLLNNDSIFSSEPGALVLTDPTGAGAIAYTESATADGAPAPGATAVDTAVAAGSPLNQDLLLASASTPAWPGA